MLLFSQIFSVRRSILVLVILQFAFGWQWRSMLNRDVDNNTDYSQKEKKVVKKMGIVYIFSIGIYQLKDLRQTAAELKSQSGTPAMSDILKKVKDYIVSLIRVQSIFSKGLEDDSSSIKNTLTWMGEELDSMDKKSGSTEDELNSQTTNEKYVEASIINRETSNPKSPQEEFKPDERNKELENIWEDYKNLLKGNLNDKIEVFKDLNKKTSTLQEEISQSALKEVEALVKYMVTKLSEVYSSSKLAIGVYRKALDGLKEQKQKLSEALRESRMVEINDGIKHAGNFKSSSVKEKKLELNEILYHAAGDAFNNHNKNDPPHK